MKTAFFGGKIYTGSMPLQEAMCIEDGKVLSVGTTEEILALCPDKAVALEGRFLCSGFEDSHMHLVSYGNLLESADLGNHTESLEEMLSYLSAFLEQHPVSEGSWLYGRGWNQDYFADVRRMPNRYDLDQVSREVPICAVRACGHALAVNSKALSLLAETELSSPIPGGRIGMENGEPDGRFFDNAMELVYDAIPAPGKNELKKKILAACRKLNAYGITACQTDDYCFSRRIPWQDINDAYRELEREGKLTVRVWEQANFTTVPELQIFLDKGNCTGSGTGLFRIGPLKLLGDGALGARTAYLSIPYADDSTTRGIPVFSQEEMDRLIDCAHRQGMQIAVHAIGDACLDMVLDAFEKAAAAFPRENCRHGIVHCQITRQDQLERLQRMGLHIYAQTIFLDYDSRMAESRVGKKLAETSYHWKALMDMGLSVSNGSDCPVEAPDVLAGIQCAVTRRPLDGSLPPYCPDQAFSVAEALDSYTIRCAESTFAEAYRGRLLPGYYADFTILDGNPLETDPKNLKDIPIFATYLEGKKVYENNSL